MGTPDNKPDYLAPLVSTLDLLDNLNQQKEDHDEFIREMQWSPEMEAAFNTSLNNNRPPPAPAPSLQRHGSGL